MDVRCEKCQTEYELDESKLKPGGVTVKCTQCGHMFKIRRRESAVHSAQDAHRSRPPSASPSAMAAASRASSSSGVPRALTSDFGSGPSAERIWIIRLDNGETRTCRELGTLQQWILSGLVTRESMISRTGKTWKRLGDIAELASFFQVADEARFQRTNRDSGRITSPVAESSGPRKTAIGSAAAPDLGARRVTAEPRAAGRPSAPAESKSSADARPGSAADAKARSTLVGVPSATAEPAIRPPGAPAGPSTQRMAAATPEPRTPGASKSPAPAPATQKMSTTQAAAAAAASGVRPGGASKSPVGAASAAPAQASSGQGSGANKLSTPPPRRPSKASTPPPIPAAALAHAPAAPAVDASSSNAAPAASRPRAAATPPPPIPARSAAPSIPASSNSEGSSGSTSAGPSSGAPVLSERSTGAWAASEIRPLVDDSAGPRGPVGGAVRGGAAEPAFAGGGAPPAPSMLGAPGRSAPASMSFDPVPREYVGAEETSPVLPPRRGVGIWIVLGSMTVIAAAAVVLYLTVFRARAGNAAAGDTVLDAGVAGDAVVAAGDAILDAAAAAATASDAVVAAHNALIADAAPGLSAALGTIASDPSPAAIALHPRLLTALAQALQDEAALTLTIDKKRAEELQREARQKLLDAIKPAQRALREAADQPVAHVAMADLLRLQGKPTADVRRHLERALSLAAGDREARLVGALLDLRDGKAEEARGGLQALDRGADTLEQSGDVRARFRLAVMSQTGGDTGAARTGAESVLAVASDHAAARALLARLGEGVSTSDPLPPEVDDDKKPGDKPDKPGDKPDKPVGTTPPAGTDKPAEDKAETGGESYDRLLSQANKAAEVDCGKAMVLYERAIDARPNGVEALTGAGYCHVDRKEFSSAHSKFRAALAVSSRFERALWGIAEAYQQQGRSELATEAYRRYLEVYPDSAAAKRQLDKLGGGADKPSAPEPTPSAPAAPGGGTDSPRPTEN